MRESFTSPQRKQGCKNQLLSLALRASFESKERQFPRWHFGLVLNACVSDYDGRDSKRSLASTDHGLRGASSMNLRQ